MNSQILGRQNGSSISALVNVSHTVLFAVFAMSSLLDVRAQAVIKVDGSSTVFPVTEAVAEEFQKEKKGKVRVTVGISGTGGGFKKFSRGETDVQNASRPILVEEMATCKQNAIEYI